MNGHGVVSGAGASGPPDEAAELPSEESGVEADPLAGDLVSVLRRVANEGWNGPAGATVVAVIRKVCRYEARRWAGVAGWLDADEAIGRVWEVLDRLIQTGRIEDGSKVLRRQVSRIFAGEAAAVQTGMGHAATRGLVALARQDRSKAVVRDDAILERIADADVAADGAVAPEWMHLAADLLTGAGWHWPVPPLAAVMATAACATRTGRAARSPLAAHDTGVPAATWGALELLLMGSGPGCAPEHAAAPLPLLADVFGDRVGDLPEVRRLTAAAVAGRTVRTGRRNRKVAA